MNVVDDVNDDEDEKERRRRIEDGCSCSRVDFSTFSPDFRVGIPAFTGYAHGPP